MKKPEPYMHTLKEAKRIAAQHGMFIVTRRQQTGPAYLLYREMEHTANIFLGKRSTPSSLRELVMRCAGQIIHE